MTQENPFIKIRTFSDIEEIFSEMERDEDLANTKVLPGQDKITWDSYVFRAVEGEQSKALAIWGHIWSLEENLERERKAGATEEELEYTKAKLLELHDRGYRYGEWWSVVCHDRPDIGDAHISTLWPISRRDFEYARRMHWEIWSSFLTKTKAEVAMAKQQKIEQEEAE